MRRANRAGRARVGPIADRHATELSTKLGRSLREARNIAGLKQAQAAARAGLSQSGWSRLERDGDARYTVATWDRAAHAVGARLHAYIEGVSAADRPRDAVHVKNQELLIRMALGGGWRSLPEEAIDREVSRSRWADVLLSRRRVREPAEYALMEVIDWFDDVGAATRAWGRRLEAVERYAIGRMLPGDDQPLPRASGCWLIRATQRNRALVGELHNFLRARFPGSGRAWLAALTNRATPMPSDPALLWVSLNGDRLFAARLGAT